MVLCLKEISVGTMFVLSRGGGWVWEGAVNIERKAAEVSDHVID